MNKVSRRTVLSGITAVGLSSRWPSFAQANPKILVVGGGFGGSTFAKYISSLLPSADITLVDSSASYFACPLSNLVIAGQRSIEQQKIRRTFHTKTNLNIVTATAKKISAKSKSVTLADDSHIAFDKLVVSPGIDFKWDAIEGYDQSLTTAMPHAWRAGEQTLLLRRALSDMDDGGLVVISVPRAPFRCPPGPYERASLIAYYLKRNKPKSKVLILDANEQFSKQPQFTAEWSKNYKNMIEWRSSSEDGRVIRVGRRRNSVHTDFESFRPAVANVIPHQQAGSIAHNSGLTDATGWCPINPITFESTLQKDVYVLGDATIAAPMPKSAFSANMQAKVCAIQLARKIRGLEVQPTIMANTCYSFISPQTAISIVGVYNNDNGLKSVENSGGVSPIIAEDSEREAEAWQAKSWFSTITKEAFA